MSQKRETMTFKSMHRNKYKILFLFLDLLNKNRFFGTIHCITGIAVSSAIPSRCRRRCPRLLLLPPPQALPLSVCPMPPPPLLQFAVKDTMEYRGLPVDTRLGQYIQWQNRASFCHHGRNQLFGYFVSTALHTIKTLVSALNMFIYYTNFLSI